MKVKHFLPETNLELIVLTGIFFFILSLGYLTVNLGFNLNLFSQAQTPWQQQGTFEFARSIKTVSELPTGKSMPGDAAVYCISDEDPTGCGEGSGFHIPKGSSGATGKCGTVISQAQKIIGALDSDEAGLISLINADISDCNYKITKEGQNYLSTYLVVDAFNLAGFKELSKENPDHVLGSNLLKWWQSQPKGYKYIQYTPGALSDYATGQSDLTGCAIFLEFPSGVHTGIVNSLQMVNANGDGVLSFLQSNAHYLIERIDVVGWKFKNSTLDAKKWNSIVGFGCRQ
ncbi:hypothetical protein A2963_00575 [Candidatus Roizmanbacteria bacterium RIFCSPLOWO2_01_FULL_40_13]|nr:MAG: hypothetical protein A2963_00575 [Candidatus Roizmanbacteria bacterium RIFCSPLOWO2_01_FULL_40_13]